MRYVVLLRGINVGGTGKLPMKNLQKICLDLGFENVQTYIQSGNILLESKLSPLTIKSAIESALDAVLNKKAHAIVRNEKEWQTVLSGNPFSNLDPKKVGVLFLPSAQSKKVFENLSCAGPEKIVIGKKEIYIFFPNGMGRSKLKLPADLGTMRNLNTVLKLGGMLRELL